MNKTELIAGLRAHLADKEDIANEAAPALALMRYAVVELEKPTSVQGNNTDAGDLQARLDAMNTAAGRLHAQLADREGFIYSLLADLGMVPEVDDEPVDSLAEALELAPNLLDELQTKVANLYATGDEEADDKDRFIDGVRNLLNPIAPQGAHLLSLQELWNLLEAASDSYASREQGIVHRDNLLLQADARLQAIREKLGIPEGAGGSVEQLELANIDLLMQQRQAAQDRLAVGRDEAPAEGTLEAILEEVITIMRLDWQDVEQLPQDIQKLRDDANAMLKAQTFAVSGGVPMAGWVSDAVDLAHAVRGNLAPENRVMAKAAEAIILSAPGGSDA